VGHGVRGHTQWIMAVLLAGLFCRLCLLLRREGLVSVLPADSLPVLRPCLQVAFYCSPQCQRQAWSGDSHMHKEQCPWLSQFWQKRKQGQRNIIHDRSGNRSQQVPAVRQRHGG